MLNLLDFRLEKDSFFASHNQSPLTIEQKRLFDGLDYFPEAPGLRFETKVERLSDHTEVHIPTSTGDMQVYNRYGKFRFQVEGEACRTDYFCFATWRFSTFR